MRLFEITNSYRRLVHNQLTSTDAKLVKVYSLGNATVIYTKAPTHQEIVIKSDQRDIQEDEINFTIKQLMHPNAKEPQVIRNGHLVEISIQYAASH